MFSGKGGWMSDARAAHPLLPRHQTSTHQETTFVPVIPSLLHFTQDTKAQITHFCAEMFQAPNN